MAPLENDELLPQTQVLSHQSRLGFDGGGEDAGKGTDHLLIACQLLQSDQRSNTGSKANAIDGWHFCALQVGLLGARAGSFSFAVFEQVDAVIGAARCCTVGKREAEGQVVPGNLSNGVV